MNQSIILSYLHLISAVLCSQVEYFLCLVIFDPFHTLYLSFLCSFYFIDVLSIFYVTRYRCLFRLKRVLIRFCVHVVMSLFLLFEVGLEQFPHKPGICIGSQGESKHQPDQQIYREKFCIYKCHCHWQDCDHCHS